MQSLFSTDVAVVQGMLVSGASWLLLGVVVSAVVWLVVRRREDGRRYTAALAFVALAFGLEASTEVIPVGWWPTIQAVALLAFFFGIVRAIAVTIDLVARQRRKHFSTILRDLVTVVLYAVVVLIVLRTTLAVDLTPLLATSAVATAVIGFALQETLGNVFAGLALQMQKPFDPGDWIRVGDHVGRVQGIGWRSTTIITKALTTLQLPNSQLAKDVVANLRGTTVGDWLYVGTSYADPPNKVKAVVLDVLSRNPEIAPVPTPRCEVHAYEDFSVRYGIRFWMTDFGRSEQIRDAIMTSLWYAFRRNDITIPYPVRTVYMHEGATIVADQEERRRDRHAALRRVDFLSELSDENLDLLEPSAHEAAFGQGEIICREGEAGDSFYVLRRGGVEVVARAGGRDTPIAELKAPAFFGEMAMLTGEPRAATVRAKADAHLLVVDREGFERLFQARPAVAEEVSRILAQRQSELSQRRREAIAAESAEQRSQTLLSKMQELFKF